MKPEILKAVQEERRLNLVLIEAPIPGLLEMAEKYERVGKDSTFWRTTVKTLQDAATSVRESGAFRDACEARKAGAES